MAEKTVKMDLPAAKAHKGIAYGPGKDIEVPESAAKAFGAYKATEPRATEKKAEKGK